MLPQVIIMEQLEFIKLVEAREEDANRLADISKRAFHTDVQCGAPGEGGPPGYDSPKAQARFMKECDYYKILYEEIMAGAIMAIRRRRYHYECCGLFVDPEYHNRGIATKAFEVLWTRYPDAKLWTVETPAWNTRTNHFYTKLGFEKIGKIGSNMNYFEKVISSDQIYTRMTISELRDSMNNVEIEAKVLEISKPRVVKKRATNESLTVATATLIDESGTIHLTLWNEQINHVSPNDLVRIENGYINSFRGEIQLNVGRYGKIIVLS